MSGEEQTFCVEYGFVSGRTHNKALLNMKFDVCMHFGAYRIVLASSCNDSFCNYCMLMLTSFSQLSQAGHERLWITKSEVNLLTFGPSPYVAPQGNQKQSGEGTPSVMLT